MCLRVVLVLGEGVDAQEPLDLAAGDGDGGGRGEPRDYWHRDEVYQEAELEDAKQENNETGGEREEDSVVGAELLGLPLGEHVPCHDSHDGGGADGDVLAAAEHAVGEAAHEGGVEAVLGREPGHDGVGDALRDDGEANSEAGNEVRDTGAEVIPRQPVQDRQLPA